jgi:uncharacterized membrane protein SirB2
MYTALFHTHRLVVSIFLALYFVKMVLLLMNKRERLDSFRKMTKVPEMIVATLFLITGVWMLWINQTVSFSQILKFIAIIAAIPFGVIGFNKGKKLFGVLSFVMLVVAYGLAEMGKRLVKIDPLPTEIVTDPMAEGYDKTIHGGAIYNVQCLRCHGRDGSLGATGAYDLATSKLEREGLIQIIRYGKGQMPGFEDVLTEYEIEAVADYTEKLRTN